MSTRSIIEASCCVILSALIAIAGPGPARAEDPPAAEDSGLTLELNKVEDAEGGCQTYFLLDNRSGHVFDAFRLDLILFDGRGVIGDRLRLDLAPVRSDKRIVWTYVFPDTACAEIGSILVNDIPVCEARGGAAVDCIDLLKVSGRDSIPLEK